MEPGVGQAGAEAGSADFLTYPAPDSDPSKRTGDVKPMLSLSWKSVQDGGPIIEPTSGQCGFQFQTK